jgi:hypothetical protein
MAADQGRWAGGVHRSDLGWDDVDQSTLATWTMASP